MNYLEAAIRVLAEANEPLHYAEIARRAIVRGFIEPRGKTPEATMGSRLYVDTKREDTRLKRASRGYFGLAEGRQSDEIAKRVEALNEGTRRTLRKLLRDMPPDKFEALIGELLIALGFDEETVEVTNFSSDGGVDVRGVLQAGGITSVNAAVQVKRTKSNIHAPVVQKVRGALTTHEQGIIITTSDFSKGARAEAVAIGKTPISLVNGEDLLQLLVKHNIGVTKESHTVLSIDEEWWGELVEPPSHSPALTASPVTTSVKVTFPLTVRAGANDGTTASLLNLQGEIDYNGKLYSSPSTAGQDASGWKACNGWKYWQFRDPTTGQWQLIDVLREKKA